MAVGSGTVEAERHIIGSGREEQDIGEQFSASFILPGWRQ